MQIKSFNGALNTRVDAALITSTEAREFVNIDSDTAVLTPVADSVVSVMGAKKYSYYSVSDAAWQFSDTPTDWLEFKEILYKADRITQPTKSRNGVVSNLGIARPEGDVVMTPDSAAFPIQRADILAIVGSGNLPPDDYQYKIVNKFNGKLSTSYSSALIEISRNNSKIPSFAKRVESSLRPTGDPVEGLVVSAPLAITKVAGLSKVFSNFKKKSVDTTVDTVTIDVLDDDCDEFIVYRNYDGKWKAVLNTFTTKGTLVTDDTFDISANDELDEITGIDGIIQYAFTFYDSTTGVESAPSFTGETEVEVGIIQLTDIPVSTDSQVDTVRIYRLGNNLSEFTLVDTVANGVTSYNDILIDTELAGSLLVSRDYDPAPVGLQYLTEAYAMLFGALNDQLRFTPIGKPNAWPTQYFLDFPTPITGISKTSIGLLVHTYFKTYLVTGTGPSALSQQLLSGDQGCISHDSIVETQDTALWASTDGLCASDGSDVEVLSRDKLGKLTLVPTNAALFDQVYYLQLTDGSTLALDFDRGQLKNFDYGVESLVIAEDVLYGYADGALRAIEAASTKLSMTYRSPDFTAGSLTLPKVYKDIQVFSSGQIALTVYVNGQDAGTFNFTTTDSHEVKIDKAFMRGFYISFLVQGTGEVRTITWTDGTANV